jgi:hypothetical protein
LVFNAPFSSISAISWRPVLVVEEPEYPERTTDPGQATGKLYHLRLWVECTLFCNLQNWVRTHAVLVIGLYELLDGNDLTHWATRAPGWMGTNVQYIINEMYGGIWNSWVEQLGLKNIYERWNVFGENWICYGVWYFPYMRYSFSSRPKCELCIRIN